MHLVFNASYMDGIKEGRKEVNYVLNLTGYIRNIRKCDLVITLLCNAEKDILRATHYLAK